MEEPFYVIVHPAVVEGLAGKNEDHRNVLEEIKRIQEKGNCILCPGRPYEITDLLPENAKTREIRVCGAFSGKELKYAVDETCRFLRGYGYNAVVYGPGTYFAY
jgi:hypothetical protein